MEKFLLPLLIISSLLINGCQSTPKKKSSKSNQITSFSSINSESQSVTSANPTSSTSQDGQTSKITSNFAITSTSKVEPTSDQITGIDLLDPYIKAHVGVRSDNPLLNIYYADGVNPDDVDKTLTWEISDHSVASVDSYGRVTGIKRGKTTLTCTSVVGHHSASITVYVLNKNEEFVEKLLKIENVEIAPGDDIMIANANHNVAAGKVDTGSYLHPETITLTDNKNEITNYGEAALFKVLEDKKGREGLVLECPDRDGNKFLGTSNTSNINYYASNNTTQTLWDIHWDSQYNYWDMRASSVTQVDGWMMYNVQNEKFSTYQSGVSSVLELINLYRLTVIIDL